MNLAIQEAVRNGKDIVWDQTNLNPRSRRNKLRMLKGYTKNAVVFKIPSENILTERLANRPGKIIPENVINHKLRRCASQPTQKGLIQLFSLTTLNTYCIMLL